MATGTVKSFNPTKGYRFVQPQGGGKDVFVHISAVERAGLSTLNEGQNRPIRSREQPRQGNRQTTSRLGEALLASSFDLYTVLGATAS